MKSDYESNYKYTMKQNGLTIELKSALISALQLAYSTVKNVSKVGESTNDRINAMAAANAGFSAYRTYETFDKLNDALQDGLSDVSTDGLKVSITYSQQKNVQTQRTEGNRVEKSEVNAGGKVNINATGAGNQSQITIAGSDVSGQQGTHLNAEGDIHLLAVDENHHERSKNKSTGWNLGVALAFQNGVSFGVTAGANVAKGYGNGDSQAWVSSQVGSLNSLTTINTDGDTNIKGSQVKGKGVQLSTTNLNIESLQDTMAYKGKQQQVSGSVTVGYGFSAGGSYGQSKVNADYASVQEQAGIFAGDEGYQIDVKNHTDLVGGLVTSTQNAETENRNHFETGTLSSQDIQNHSRTKGSSFGMSGGIAMNFETPLGDSKTGQAQSQKQAVNKKGEKVYDKNGNPVFAEGLDSLTGNMSVGVGSVKESQSSTTKSGINTQNLVIRDSQGQLEKTGQTVEATKANIKTEATTENYLSQIGALENKFDKEKVLKELNLQVKVTQEFRENATNVIGNVINPKQAEIREKIKKAKTEEEKTALYQDLYKLQYQKRLLETVVGIVAGSPEVAITQGTLQLAATKMREISLESSRRFTGIKDEKTGKVLRNDSYKSGFYDDVKLGGVRIDKEAICGADRCIENSDGSYTYIDNKDPKLPTLMDAINPEKNPRAKGMYGPTGGFQAIEGGWYLGRHNFMYDSGSFSDMLVEAFAGTHDFLGGQMWGWYDEKGNTAQKSPLGGIVAEVTTVVAIPVSAPFALSELISPEFLEILIKLGGY